MTRSFTTFAIVLVVLLSHSMACSNGRATSEDCRAILSRIVTIELSEQGYRDPVLLDRKRSEALQRFAGELDACIGRRLPAHARSCIDRAQTTETLVHDCLAR